MYPDTDEVANNVRAGRVQHWSTTEESVGIKESAQKLKTPAKPTAKKLRKIARKKRLEEDSIHKRKVKQDSYMNRECLTHDQQQKRCSNSKNGQKTPQKKHKAAQPALSLLLSLSLSLSLFSIFSLSRNTHTHSLSLTHTHTHTHTITTERNTVSWNNSASLQASAGD